MGPPPKQLDPFVSPAALSHAPLVSLNTSA